MRDLVTAVEAAVGTVRAASPFLPVTVVVPSRLLGLWLGPRLFAGTGHIAIDFALLPEVAWRVAAPRLALQGQRPIPENVDLALLLSVVDEAAQGPRDSRLPAQRRRRCAASPPQLFGPCRISQELA